MVMRGILSKNAGLRAHISPVFRGAHDAENRRCPDSVCHRSTTADIRCLVPRCGGDGTNSNTAIEGFDPQDFSACRILPLAVESAREGASIHAESSVLYTVDGDVSLPEMTV
jgi:hypothetical protein